MHLRRSMYYWGNKIRSEIAHGGAHRLCMPQFKARPPADLKVAPSRLVAHKVKGI